MAKTRAEVEGRAVVLAEAENPIVHLKVRKKGDGKISTGEHHPKGGDVLFEEGETLSVRRDVAQALIDLDYVDEIADPNAPVEPKPKADAK
jgi:hypothetical protein